MGINNRAVRRWLKTLKDQGYITTRRTGRSLEIWINKWKSAGGLGKSPRKRSIMSSQNGNICPIRVAKYDRLKEVSKGRNSSNPRRKSAELFFPNERTITKDLLDIDIDDKKILDSDRQAVKGFTPKGRRGVGPR